MTETDRHNYAFFLREIIEVQTSINSEVKQFLESSFENMSKGSLDLFIEVIENDINKLKTHRSEFATYYLDNQGIWYDVKTVKINQLELLDSNIKDKEAYFTNIKNEFKLLEELKEHTSIL